MTIEEYDYINIPGTKCRECGTETDIVEDFDGYICTDCLFEKRFWEQQAEERPPSSFS